MDTQTRIATLETLLKRIQRNSAALAMVRGAPAANDLPGTTEFSEGLRSVPAVAPIQRTAQEPPPVAAAQEEDLYSLPPDALESVPPPAAADEFSDPNLTAAEIRSRTETLGGLGVSLGFSPSEPPPGMALEVEADRATPPPESGRQVSSASQLDPANSAEIAQLAVEQRGGTVALEPGASESLELGEPEATAVARASSELEEQLPSSGFQGQYDSSLAPPAGAKADLEKHDREQRERALRHSAVPEAMRTEPPSSEGVAAGADLEVRRPAVDTTVPAATITQRIAQKVRSFLERLDNALKL